MALCVASVLMAAPQQLGRRRARGRRRSLSASSVPGRGLARDRLLVCLAPGGPPGEVLPGNAVEGEIRRLEHLPELDFLALLERDALHPFKRVLLRFHVDQPEAGDEFPGLGKGPVGDLEPALLELHPSPVAARLQAFGGEQYAGLDELLV